MMDNIGRSKVQRPASKRYSFVAIPKPIENLLEIERGQELAWLGIHIGDEQDNEPIAVAFIVDKAVKLEAQAKRIMRLLEE